MILNHPLVDAWLRAGMCVFEIPCVYSACLQPGQCHSKPWVCHSQCQVSQHDADTQRGLRRATDPPPAPPALPQVKGQPVPSIPPDEEVFPSLLTPFLAHMLLDCRLRPPERPLNRVLHADRSSWCLRGTVLWDNWQLQRSPPDRPLSIQISTIDK